MEHFHLIDTGIDVGPVLDELDAHPELWDQHNYRKTAPGTPHSEMSDIWVRFRPIEELTSPETFGEPHVPVFYPAWDALPSLKPIVQRLMDKIEPDYLGGILITKIPPGGKIAPHHDRGGWHAEFFTQKFYIPLQSNEGCINYCEDEHESMQAGEVWSFDNLKMHSVENNGDTDRITLIVTMRVE